MMTHVDHRLAKALREDARTRVERVRRSHPVGEFLVGGVVKDAIGHGLIALGSRLVTDPHEHPRHRAA